MLPERMRARRAPSSGKARGTTIVATHGPIVAGSNAGTRITTRHVNPTPSAAFASNSAKANTGLLGCCWARVCKRYNRQKADGRQITHCICPSVDGSHPIVEPLARVWKSQGLPAPFPHAYGGRAANAEHSPRTLFLAPWLGVPIGKPRPLCRDSQGLQRQSDLRSGPAASGSIARPTGLASSSKSLAWTNKTKDRGQSDYGDVAFSFPTEGTMRAPIPTPEGLPAQAAIIIIGCLFVFLAALADLASTNQSLAQSNKAWDRVMATKGRHPL